MLDALVVDTNVFVHASNPGVTYCAEARNLITALEGVPTVLHVDDRSLIMGEYLEHLQIGMLAFAFVSTWASTGRIIPVSSSVVPTVGRRINQIIRNKRDRTFLKVAMNSDDHFLCSHDFNDFSHRKRAEIKNIFGVRVKTAGETLPFL